MSIRPRNFWNSRSASTSRRVHSDSAGFFSAGVAGASFPSGAVSPAPSAVAGGSASGGGSGATGTPSGGSGGRSASVSAVSGANSSHAFLMPLPSFSVAAISAARFLRPSRRRTTGALSWVYTTRTLAAARSCAVRVASESGLSKATRETIPRGGTQPRRNGNGSSHPRSITRTTIAAARQRPRRASTAGCATRSASNIKKPCGASTEAPRRVRLR